jgi:hypothetical protein
MRPYKRKPGEFEIRILPDGQVLMPAPDDSILDLARKLKLPGMKPATKEKAKKNGRAKTRRARKKTD